MATPSGQQTNPGSLNIPFGGNAAQSSGETLLKVLNAGAQGRKYDPAAEVAKPADPAIVQKSGQTATDAVIQTRNDYVNSGRSKLQVEQQNYIRTAAGNYLSI
jgi:hypothetical protein